MVYVAGADGVCGVGGCGWVGVYMWVGVGVGVHVCVCVCGWVGVGVHVHEFVCVRTCVCVVNGFMRGVSPLYM